MGFNEIEKANQSQIDILILHWPESVYWRGRSELFSEYLVAKAFFSLVRLKARGVKIVWMVHNLRPHDASRRRMLVWRIYSSGIAKIVDGVIALSPATLPIILKAFPFERKVQTLSIRHPAYPAGASLDRGTARVSWHVADSPRVLTFVGSMRTYKGIVELLQTVARMPGICSLVAGGRCEEGLREALSAVAENSANIDFRPHRLADAEFEGLVLASDYVVLPFLDHLHSGSVVHALSLGRPVLTRQTAFTADLQSVVGSDWVHLFDGDLSSEAIEALPPPPTRPLDLGVLSPSLIGRQIVDFCSKLKRLSARTSD